MSKQIPNLPKKGRDKRHMTENQCFTFSLLNSARELLGKTLLLIGFASYEQQLSCIGEHKESARVVLL